MKPILLTEAQERRFWAKVALPNGQGCMLWLGSLQPTGYAQISMGRKWMFYAHRVAYTLRVGPIPEGLVIDHLCRVRHCVAPDHLEAVTQQVNMLRGVGASAINAARTHCKSGHAFDEKNTYVTKQGRRHCRKCRADGERERQRRLRAAA